MYNIPAVISQTEKPNILTAVFGQQFKIRGLNRTVQCQELSYDNLL